MKNINAVFMLLCFVGCRAVPENPASFEYRFERTPERTEAARKRDGRLITVRFDGVPFGQAMGVLSEESGVPIVWSQTLDATQASGTFTGVPLGSVLEVLARRSGAGATELGGVYFLGEIKKEDRLCCVLRIPGVKHEPFREAVRSALSANGSVELVGSCVWISDDMESIRKIVAAVESVREKHERSYIAEVYFIRVNEEHFINFSAQLQFNRIDVFSSGWNIEQLFNMFVEGDAGTGWARISQRPVLYLSEGRTAELTDGNEITRENRTLTQNGDVETTGYSRFSDGLQIKMLLNRVSDLTYAVDMDLSVSMFDKSDTKSTIPPSDKSSYKVEGLRVEDSRVYYVGSLRSDIRNEKAGLFSFDSAKRHDMLTIWLRVRELKQGEPAPGSTL